MFKRFFLIIFIAITLVSCSKERDIFDTNNNFTSKNIESPFYGNKNSKIQLMIFSDFQCPACIVLNNAIHDRLFNDYINTWKIGITYKNYPLNIHKNAKEDALAWLCAHEQGKYEEFSQKMYKLEEVKWWLIITKEDRLEMATNIWLDKMKFTECTDKWFYVDRIKKDMEDWKNLDLAWTPSIYINGKFTKLEKFDELFPLLDNLLK